MCGLVGVAGNIAKAEKDMFNYLLLVDSLRGEDSTGAGLVEKFNDNYMIHKRVGNPFNLMSDRKYEKATNKNLRVMLGHNRFATQGGINEINAHPFDFDNIFGAHNGTLRNQRLLPDHKDFEVDSENIFYSINKDGIEETAMKLDGAFALTWWNKEDETINFFKNDERTFWFCHNKTGDAVFWASEIPFLEFAAKKAGIEITKPLSPRKHNLFTTKITGSGKIPPFYGGELKAYKPPFSGGKYVSTKTNNEYTYHYNNTKQVEHKKKTDEQEFIMFQSESPSVTNDQALAVFNSNWTQAERLPTGSFLGHNKKIISPPNMEKILKKGCSYCTSPVEVDETKQKQPFWLNRENDYMCDDCVDYLTENPGFDNCIC